MKLVQITASLLLWSMVATPAAGEAVSTFTLDGFSFVSFGDEEIVPLPAGSTIQFRFGTTGQNGSTPFRIDPGDVSIADVPLRSGATLRYGILGPATGTLISTSSGRRLEFSATVEATLLTKGANHGTQRYSMQFTTDSAGASDLSGAQTLSVTGTRLTEGGLYGQIVGATTNKSTASPQPGTAVITVLSGSFDRMP